MFIELTTKEGNYKFIGNVNLLQRVAKLPQGGSYVIGWNNNGGFEVQESYEEIIKKIDSRTFKVLRT